MAAEFALLLLCSVDDGVARVRTSWEQQMERRLRAAFLHMCAHARSPASWIGDRRSCISIAPSFCRVQTEASGEAEEGRCAGLSAAGEGQH